MSEFFFKSLMQKIFDRDSLQGAIGGFILSFVEKTKQNKNSPQNKKKKKTI